MKRLLSLFSCLLLIGCGEEKEVSNVEESDEADEFIAAVNDTLAGHRTCSPFSPSPIPSTAPPRKKQTPSNTFLRELRGKNLVIYTLSGLRARPF